MAENDLLTDEHRIRLFANALADDCDHFPVLKLFTPDAGATWLISEVDPDEPPPLPQTSLSHELERLHDLLVRGAISRTEFDGLKAKLLGTAPSP